MNLNDPPKDTLKKLERPDLAQQGIDSLLNDVLKKAHPAAAFTDLSRELSKQIAPITSAAVWYKQLPRSFEPPESPFQKLINEAARAAAVYRSLESLTDAIANVADSMRTTADFHREIMRSVQIPKSSIQLTIDAAQKASSQFSTLNFGGIREQIDAVSTLSKIHSSPSFVGISQAIQSAMSVSQLWQSPRITDFASRILRETDFRNAIIKHLEAESLVVVQPEATQFSSEQVLHAVERGLEESGILRSTENTEAAFGSMFSWWAKLPPDLRNLAIGVVIAIVSLVLEYGFFQEDKPNSQLPEKARVKIVQKIANNIFINVGIHQEDRRQFSVVIKDELPAFRSNRRDSGKIGSLTAGQVVTVKSRKRNWAQVEWKDANSQEMRTGWVFIRYLKKL
jgi:hypothetical protein